MKKIIVPIIITVCVILYYIFYFCFLFSIIDSIFKYFFGIIPIVCSIVAIKVCIDRIKEIKEGEEDDLSKY